jgi:hypothetical protein
MIVFEKSYDGESIVDIYRDVAEAVSAEYNPVMDQIPIDQYGFSTGRFRVVIEWADS